MAHRLSGRRLDLQDGRLDAPVPAPSTPAIKVVSRSGAVVTYEAASTGTAALVARHTRICVAADPRIANCAALTVHVVP